MLHFEAVLFYPQFAGIVPRNVLVPHQNMVCAKVDELVSVSSTNKGILKAIIQAIPLIDCVFEFLS